ncbi:hypothetical protein Sme01_49580 [Sphaerisporangium melleum]|uniref:Uncharacterized protein n=1 Tax=Sphaerisporangium melleum TaxID=321316 RepID=A0A917R4Z7_9ACTN|nr:hypothetical protein [Sphaerisporangium melleum]GGK89313.1 hypothetical protein GCM10007964_34980 [Sphaerisporangium melleum]GII72482.1 hypothetical protein Sme01_49580 [Sphaerisporangium melleum]
MTLHKGDREFRHPGVTHVDYKQVEMDRVLTAFLPRLWWGGSPSVLARSADLSVDDFVDTVLEYPALFDGFDRDVTRRWMETHLLDLVNRGKPGQMVAGLRPLHGFTYRFRNSRRSRPAGVDEQLYAMIQHASGGRGSQALQYLKTFFFAGVDPSTEAPELGSEIDVETQALINLSEAVRRDITDRAAAVKDRRSYPPLYPDASDLLVEDVVRLLFHQHLIPRSVLVDYLKILFAFHLALYHLRVMKVLPAMLKGEQPKAEGGFFLDVEGIPGTPAARLAERCASVWYGRIPEFVRATFAVKKLDDFAQHLVRLNKLHKPPNGAFKVAELVTLLGSAYSREREQFAGARLIRVLESSRDSGDPGDEPDTTIARILELGLDQFSTYIDVITAFRVGFHRQYITECLDSLLLKNRPGAMIAQPRQGERRFILDSRLLEVLLQIALLRPGGSQGFHTGPLRVDRFLAILRERYGLHIDALPAGDGFTRAGITDQGALRENTRAFTARLREIGFYSDMSDAYLTQTITPRYVVPA